MVKQEALRYLEDLHYILTENKASGMLLRDMDWAPYIKAVEYAQTAIKTKFIEGKSEEDYPQNLLLEIGFVIQNEDLDVISENLKKALGTLTEKEQAVISMRYEKGMTLAQVGKEFNVYGERIRQIEAKALRKLRHPRRLKLIALGEEQMKNYDDYRKEAAEATTQLVEEIKQKKELYRRLHVGNDIMDMSEELERLGVCRPDLVLGIEHLNLSVRAYNCLKRKGYNTIYDLKDVTYSDLLRVRNLGKRSLAEIVRKLDEKFNIKIIDDRDNSRPYAV